MSSAYAYLPAPLSPATWTTLTTTPAPTPGPVRQEELDATTVTPGLMGFLVTFAVVLACIPLFRSMTTKIRGVERRAEEAQDVEAQDVEAGAADPAATSPDLRDGDPR